MNRKVLFVINPVAGGKVRHIDDVIIRSHLFDDFQIVNTEYPGHAFELAKETDCDIVAAVGGDGTVNEVARGLIGSDKTLAIIPCGSGNGLALHLGISTNVNNALKKIAFGNTQKIDAALID